MKRIDAVFKNENAAESVKAELQPLRVENMMVEEITEESYGLRDFFRKMVVPESDGGHPPHLLQFDVKDEDYEKARSIIKGHDGYISDEEE
ncbi:hypothetical protein [Thalassobacillus hwangdonensis]|uniref:DUF2007 domain-containing protein n=1 Tax=Thalassobacillus hwangdonensis TaxID=546108 RepID=A0ABW3L483_9BACI